MIITVDKRVDQFSPIPNGAIRKLTHVKLFKRKTQVSCSTVDLTNKGTSILVDRNWMLMKD